MFKIYNPKPIDELENIIKKFNDQDFSSISDLYHDFHDHKRPEVMYLMTKYPQFFLDWEYEKLKDEKYSVSMGGFNELKPTVFSYKIENQYTVEELQIRLDQCKEILADYLEMKILNQQLNERAVDRIIVSRAKKIKNYIEKEMNKKMTK